MGLTVRELKKSFRPGQEVLTGVSFSARRGRILGVLGANGVGKSTLLKLLAGALGSDDGTIHFDGEELNLQHAHVRNIIGYLPEELPLYPDMYVREYLTRVGGMHELRDLDERINEVLDSLGLHSLAHRRIAHLSKGFKQRVGLAQAVLHHPQLLILDEPTSGLDPSQMVSFRRLLAGLKEDRVVIFSTHLMQEAAALCDDILILDKGKIKAWCPLDEIEKRYEVGTVEALYMKVTAF